MREFDDIRAVLDIARKNGFAEVEAEANGLSFSAKLEPCQASSQSLGASLLADIAAIDSNSAPFSTICAPCVGYFAAGPKALAIGAEVAAGEAIASIEALGLTNEVRSDLAGFVDEVLVSNGQAVEFGQPLVRLKVGGPC